MADAVKGRKGKRGARKIGRDIKKCGIYKMSGIREKNKILRVAKSSGMKRALEYATKHNLKDWATHRLGRLLSKSS